MLSRFDDLQSSLIFKVADATVAAGAMTYPLWRQALHDFSTVMSDITPIFGVAWLGVQITCKLTNICNKKRG